MTQAKLTVSVVIPAHNAADYLAECLASVRTQAAGASLEILVVDDGSTDDTSKVAASHADVVLVRLATNRGPSMARNAGIEASSGQFVAFLDADDLWPSGSLAARLEILQRRPEAGLVFGDCRQFDACGPRVETEFEVHALGTNAWGSTDIVPQAYWGLLAQNFITTGSVLVPRSVLDEVGGFCEDLRLVEDLDLWLRIAQRRPIAWCGQVCLLRRRHDHNLSRDAEAMSLAYLTVLQRQRQLLDPLPARAEARFASLRARELLQMADAAWAVGDARRAVTRARESIAARWHWRAGARLVQAWLMGAAQRRTATQRRH